MEAAALLSWTVFLARPDLAMFLRTVSFARSIPLENPAIAAGLTRSTTCSKLSVGSLSKIEISDSCRSRYDPQRGEFLHGAGKEIGFGKPTWLINRKTLVVPHGLLHGVLQQLPDVLEGDIADYSP